MESLEDIKDYIFEGRRDVPHSEAQTKSLMLIAAELHDLNKFLKENVK